MDQLSRARKMNEAGEREESVEWHHQILSRKGVMHSEGVSLPWEHH